MDNASKKFLYLEDFFLFSRFWSGKIPQNIYQVYDNKLFNHNIAEMEEFSSALEKNPA
jgi:hypothetical protein